MGSTRVGAGGDLGRRLLGLLLIATWLPLVLLSWTSLREYESRLALDSGDRLADQAKATGLQIFGRLKSLGSDLAVAGDGLPPGEPFIDLLAQRASWQDRFTALVLTPGPDAPAGLHLPQIEPTTSARLREGRIALLVDGAGREGAALWLVSPLSAGSSALIWARVRLDWLWPESTVQGGAGEGWLLFAADRAHPIAMSPDLSPGLLDHLDAVSESASGGFEWRDAGLQRFFVRFWTVPLGYEFGYPGLTALVSEPYGIGESVAELRRFLFLLVLGSLLLIALLGIRQLRSNLGPLERLAEGARLLASGNFGTRVELARRDEVGRLSEAFNQMADELERRFLQIEGARNIAAAALAPIPSLEAVARVFVEQVAPLAGEAEVVVALVDDAGSFQRIASSLQSRSVRYELSDISGLLPAADLGTGAEWVTGEADSVWRSLRRGEETLALVGVLGAKVRGRDALTALLSGACDQLALAFAHIKLLEDLDRANWGALTALARAVDAKSPWTHGHSTRVAEIAVAIAAEIGLTPAEIERIRRGCLVHDVGKIGVPSAVLDKPTPLGNAEITMLHSHVEKGARILQPIEGLADVLPIVWQHHERLDGSGYPKGLCGGEIDPAAALVAVADVFEALTAARPYRAAWSGEEVERYLRGLAGVQFDAGFVAALFRIRERHRSWAEEA